MKPFKQSYLECSIADINSHIEHLQQSTKDSLTDFLHYLTQLQKETEKLENLTEQLKHYSVK